MSATCSLPGCTAEAVVFALMLAEDSSTSELSLCTEHIGYLEMDYLLPSPRQMMEASRSNICEPCKLYAVLLMHQRQEYFLVLKGISGEFVFLVPTGNIEASWIWLIAAKARYSSPPTHEMIVNIIQTLGANPLEAVVYGYIEDTNAYKCHLVLRTHDGIVTVDCRVSDAVAVSLVADVPLRVSVALLGKTRRGACDAATSSQEKGEPHVRGAT